MGDYLSNLVARSYQQTLVLQPWPASPYGTLQREQIRSNEEVMEQPLALVQPGMTEGQQKSVVVKRPFLPPTPQPSPPSTLPVAQPQPQPEGAAVPPTLPVFSMPTLAPSLLTVSEPMAPLVTRLPLPETSRPLVEAKFPAPVVSEQPVKRPSLPSTSPLTIEPLPQKTENQMWIRPYLPPLMTTAVLPQPVSHTVENEPPATIQVTIGRIEVRATPPATAPTPKRTAAPVMSLEEYLRHRRKGENR